MQINSEPADKHTIQAYSNKAVKINDVVYDTSLIITAKEIVTPWDLTQIEQLSESSLDNFLAFNPKIIIIGHLKPKASLPLTFINKAHQLGIGAEILNLASACRTFNILLNEGRDVALGLIL